MKKILLSLTIALSLVTVAQSQSQTVGFAWDASPDANIVAGYNLYLNDTNKISTTNGLSTRVQGSIFALDIDSKITATAFDTNNIESEPSNAVYVNSPSAPFSLSATKQGNTSFNIDWATHSNTNVNAYNVYLGTNVNSLAKIGTVVGRLNSAYTIYNSNFVYGVSNFVAISAFNNQINSVLESVLSTNLHVPLPPRPAKNLRVSVIIQSSTNLVSWQNVTNYEYLTYSDAAQELFRAKMLIAQF